jgi:VCBS repeat-containing protein
MPGGQPTPTIAFVGPIAGDGVINSTELASGITLSGSDTNVVRGHTYQVIITVLNASGQTVKTYSINNLTTSSATLNWSTSASVAGLPDGSYTFRAALYDTTLPFTSPLATTNSTVVIDTTATIALNTFAADWTLNKAEAAASQVISGTTLGVDAGQSVAIKILNGTTTVSSLSASVLANGTWSVVAPANVLTALANGAYTISVSVADKAGNLASASHSLTVDETPPAPPSALADAAIANGYVNLAHNTAAQALTGTAEAGSKIIVYDNGVKLGETTAATNGTWSYTLGVLADRAHSLTATATDAAGNLSNASSALAFTVDTAPPSAPSALANAGIVGGYVNLASDNAAQALTGGAEAGSKVVIYDNGAKLGETSAAANGTWSYTLGAFGNGPHSLTATATDAAGNVSALSTALAFTVNTSVSPVSAPALEDGSNSVVDALVNAPGNNLTVTRLPTTLPPGVSYNQAQHAFTLDAHSSVFQNLATGEATSVTVNYYVSNGAIESPASITWTITGTNDGPVLAVDTLGNHALSEVVGVTGGGGSDSASVTLSFSDVDLSDTHTVSYAQHGVANWSGSGTIPQATLAALANGLTLTSTDSTGSGTGSVKADFALADKLADFLAAGQTLTVSYDVTVKDSHDATSTQTVTFQLTGTNDGPVASAYYAPSDLIELADGNANETTGTQRADAFLYFKDADLTDTHQVTATPLGNDYVGSLSLVRFDTGNPQGHEVQALLTVANAAIDHLAAGETLTQTYRITIDDQHGGTAQQDVTYTIVGTNDAPIITGAVLGSATEDGASATLNAISNASDVDDGATLLVVDVPTSLPAGVTYNAGTHTFTLDPSVGAYQSLAAGQTTTVTVNYSVSDGVVSTPASVSWTVTGTADGPQYAPSLLQAEVAENDAVRVSWGPSAGATYYNIYRETYTDGTAGPPILLGSANTLSFVDAALPAHGSYRYLVQGVNAEGTSPLASVDVNVLNDAPAGSDTTVTVLEDGTKSFSAADFGFSDVDGDALAAVVISTLPTAGSLTLNGSAIIQGQSIAVADLGALQYSPVANASGNAYASFSFQVRDNGGTANGVSDIDPTANTITINVTAVNHGPVLAADTLANHALSEVVGVTGGGGSDSASVTLGFSDVDLSDTHTVSYAQHGAANWSGVGTIPQATLTALASGLTLTSTDSTGSGTGSVKADFALPDQLADFLAAGQTLTVSYDVTVKDSHDATSTQTVTFELTGTNDLPIVDGAVVGVATQDGTSVTLDALANSSDVDSETNLAIVDLPAVLPEGVTYNAATHSFTLDPTSAAYRSLAEGQTTTVQIDYNVSDQIATTPASVKWTVTGVDDAPISLSLSSNTAPERLPGIIVGTLGGSDPDAGDTLTYSLLGGEDASLFTIVGNTLRVGASGLDFAGNAHPRVTVRATDTHGLYFDQLFSIDVVAKQLITLGGGTDSTNNPGSNVEVFGNALTLNASDQLTGSGDTILGLYGSGAFNLAGLTAFAGFAEVDLINYTSQAATLTLRPSQGIAVRTLGTGQSSITASSGHASVEVAGGNSAIYGSSGALDVTVDAGSGAAVYDSTGNVTLDTAGNATFYHQGSGTLTATVEAGGSLDIRSQGGSGAVNVTAHSSVYWYPGNYYVANPANISITSDAGDINLDGSSYYGPQSGNVTVDASASSGHAGLYNLGGLLNLKLSSDVNTPWWQNEVYVSSWRDGNVIDGSAGSNDRVNVNDGRDIDLTKSTITGIEHLNLYGGGTETVGSHTFDGNSEIYVAGGLTTASATLDLSHVTYVGRSVASTNATGTTFTVSSAQVGFSVMGGTGNDTLVANGFSFTADQRAAIFGAASVETIVDDSGTYAGASGQTLQARPNGDHLVGGSGDDLLISGVGSDVLTGNGGTDTFVFNVAAVGQDTINDFTPGVDRLQFSALVFTTSQGVLDHATQQNSDVLISLDSNDTILLHNMLLADINTSDIIIV